MNASTERSIAYIFGRTEAHLQAFAASMEIPYRELATRLGALLLSQGKGSGDRMPIVPSNSSKPRKTLAKVALDGGTHSGAQTQQKAVSGIKAYWAKMSPLQRKREIKRRLAMRKKSGSTK
jgi:hypothetical protein